MKRSKLRPKPSPQQRATVGGKPTMKLEMTQAKVCNATGRQRGLKGKKIKFKSGKRKSVCDDGKRTTAALTFFCCVAYDDLSPSFAGLLHRQCRAEPLLMLPQALAFFEAVLLHYFVGHRTAMKGGKKVCGFVNCYSLYY